MLYIRAIQADLHGDRVEYVESVTGDSLCACLQHNKTNMIGVH